MRRQFSDQNGGGRPVYSDGDSFRNVSWPEALRLLARLMDKDEEGDFRPHECAIFLRLAALKWGSGDANAD